jgi:putative transposase
MDGKGSWRDHVFVERLWCTIKYDEIYLKAYRTVTLKPRNRLGSTSISTTREDPNSSLDGVPPDTFYYQHLPQQMAA